MGGSFHTIGLAVAGIILTSGCSSLPRWALQPPDGQGAVQPVQEPAAPAPPVPGPTAADRRAMQDVMGQLQQLGAVDPAAREQLIAQMSQTDPASWPLMVQQFRAATAALPHQARHRVGRLPAANDAAMAPAHPPPGDYPNTPYPSLVARPSVRPPDGPHRPGPPERVVNASFDSVDPASGGDWLAQLAGTIRALESALPGVPNTPAEVARHAQLRMLYLLAGRAADAVRPIPAVAPAVQDFWSKQLSGLATWLDVRRTPDAEARTAETKRILDEALARLGQTAPLVVRNLAFCTKVQSYGCTRPFEKYEFTPKQHVLLYAEVENFTSKPTPDGFHTALRSSYEIFDSLGRRVARHDLATTEESCRNPRRDYFIVCDFHLPKQIRPGKHTLKLTIEDVKSRKAGHSSVELTIKGAGK